TAANTRPSSRKRTSRLAGWTLTSTSAGSSRTTTTPKGWRPPGSRPRYASSTATVRARLWTRRPLTTSTTPPRAARWARGSEVAPRDGGALGVGGGTVLERLRPADPESRPGVRIAPSRGEDHLGDRGDARQRLAAEAEACHRREVADAGDLRGGVARHRQGQL